MPLASHQPPRIIVPLLDGNSVALRGINLDDLMALMPTHFEALSKIATLYTEHQESVFSDRAMTQLILTVANTIPGVIAEVISIAADEPEAKDVRLSTGLQIACIQAILKLTVEEAGGLGNLFAQLRDYGRIVRDAQAELRARSPRQHHSNDSSGSGESKSTS